MVVQINLYKKSGSKSHYQTLNMIFMKKIFIIAISLLIVGSVSAQRRYSPRRYGPRNAPRNNYNRPQNNNNRNSGFYTPKVGFTAGANFANTTSSYNSGYNNYSTGNLTGLNVGVVFDIPLFYPLSFAPEVLYSQKGHTTATSSGNFTQRTNYIDIPLLAKIKAGPVFNIYVGPQFSYLLNTTNTYDNGFAITSQQYYENTRNTRAIFGGVLGVGFDLSQNIELRGRYNIDFNKTDYYGNTYVPNSRNQVWQVGLGFKF